MRHVLKRNKGFIAIPAVLALTLAACDTDDDSPTIEEDTDEQAVLPSGVFGDDCQELLTAADVGDTDVTTDTDADADADVDGFDDDNGLDDEDDELGVALAAAEDDDGFGEDDDENGFGEDDGIDDDAEDFGEDDGIDDDADATDDGLDTEGDAEADAEAEAETDTTATVDEQQLREMTILEALEALPDFDTLVAELRGSQLESELEQESDVTLFAATDEAFEAVTGNGDGLDTDDGVETDDTDNGVGTDDTDDGVDTDGTDDGELGTTTTVTIDDRVLAYHLHLDGALFAQDLVDQEDVSTAADDAGDLQVTADGDVVTIDADESTAQVTCANIETQDGTIHVIDEVLVPREDTDATDEETDTDADAGTETDTDAETDADTDTDADADAEADADAGVDADTDAETDDS